MANIKHWTKEEFDTVKSLIKKGQTYKQISKTTNIPEVKIRTKIYNEKIPYNNGIKKWTNKEVEILKSLVKQNLSASQISLKMDIPRKNIETKIRNYKLKTKIAKKLIENRKLKQQNKKRCITCNKIKNYHKDFKCIGKRKRKVPQCSPCYKASYLNKYQKKKKNITLNDVLVSRLSSIRTRCKTKKFEFSLDIKSLLSLYKKQNGKCFYTKLPMEIRIGTKKRDSHNILSIDRINPNRGYTEDNVVFCRDVINKMKTSFEYEEFIYMCKLISQNHKL